MTATELFHLYCPRFQSSGIENARNEVLWILAHILKVSYTQLVCGAGAEVNTSEQDEIEAAVARRLRGEPLQYILGTVEFRHLELEVGPGVLIPRPETECLVDKALELYDGSGAICDLCTGSGAVALALACELKESGPIVGTDISGPALAYAERNRKRTGCEQRVRFFCGNLFEPLPQGSKFSLITANPPYIAPLLYEKLPSEVKDYEPKIALYADQSGLSVLRQIIDRSPLFMQAGGWLICEISSEQGATVASYFNTDAWRHVAILKDYTQRDRFVRAQRL